MRVNTQKAKQVVLRYLHALKFASAAPDLLTWSNQAMKVKRKSDGTLVTGVDKKIDRILRSWILDEFPVDAICSEEGIQELDRDCWIFDPLDGTANFVNGRPQYALSIGYWSNNRPAFGIIVTPGLEEFAIISALKDYGIHIDGKKYKPQKPKTLMGGIDFRRTKRDISPEKFKNLLKYTAGEMRAIGSIAHGLTEVALGTLSFYIHSSPRIWDAAAGMALLRESKKVTNLKRIDLLKLASRKYRLPMFITAQNSKILAKLSAILIS